MTRPTARKTRIRPSSAGATGAMPPKAPDRPPAAADSFVLEETDEWGNFVSELRGDDAGSEAAAGEGAAAGGAAEPGPVLEDFLLDPVEPASQWPDDPLDPAAAPAGWTPAEATDAATFPGMTAADAQSATAAAPAGSAEDPILAALAAAAAKRAVRSRAKSAQATAAPSANHLEAHMADVREERSDLAQERTAAIELPEPRAGRKTPNPNIRTLVARATSSEPADERAADEAAGESPAWQDQRFRMLMGVSVLLLCWGALFWFTTSTTIGLLTIAAANCVGSAGIAVRRAHA